MRNLFLSLIIIFLAGCATTPVSTEQVTIYPPVMVSPGVEIVYIWDPVQFRYYWVDQRDSRHYMPDDWKHPHGYTHERDKKDDKREKDKKNRK